MNVMNSLGELIANDCVLVDDFEVPAELFEL